MCLTLNTQRELAKSDIERDSVAKQLRAHTNLHRGERNAYRERVVRAEQLPGQYTSVIMDMSNKYVLPHKVRCVIFWCVSHFVK